MNGAIRLISQVSDSTILHVCSIKLGILSPDHAIQLAYCQLRFDLNRASSKSTSLKWYVFGQLPRLSRTNKQGDHFSILITGPTVAAPG